MNKVAFSLLVALSLISLLPGGARAHPIHLQELPPRGRAITSTAFQTAGEDGVSFSVGRTLGTTGSPYPVDPSYLNYPNGIYAEGSTVWITESEGRQITQMSNQGVFQRSIGQTGMMSYQGTTLCWLTDVAMDPDGHLWVVDQCAGHVIEFDVNGNVLQELGQAWSRGATHDRFQLPMGVAVDSDGNVFVSDGANPWNSNEGNHRIQVYDADGNYLNTIGTTGVAGASNQQFLGPRYIFIDAAGLLYVADSGNHRVQIFNVTDPLSPTYVATLGATGESGWDQNHFNYPSGVAVTDSAIYVADTQNNRVQVYDRNSRDYLATVGTGFGYGAYEFKSPLDVDVDDAGNVYVVDTGNVRVQQFNSSYAYRRTLGTTGVPYVTDDLHYNHPAGVAVDPDDGSIYLVEERGHRLVKLNGAGSLLWTAGEAGVKGWDNEHFHYPRDVALDDRGYAYVADSLNHRIQVYDATGTYSSTLGSRGSGEYQFNTPNGIAVSPDGHIYVADTGNHRVQIYDQSLTYVNTVRDLNGNPCYFEWPEDVAVDTRGYIYVADAGRAYVMVLDATFDHLYNLGPDLYSYDSFSYPVRLATDKGDNLYVADSGQDRIYHFRLPQNWPQELIGEGAGNAPGQLDNPYGLAIGSQGELYVGDRDNQRLQEFTRSSPQVTAFRPFTDTVDVPSHRWVSVTFNESMDPTSINTDSFKLYREGGGVVAGSVDYIPASRVAVFRPSAQLAPSTHYTAHVTTDIRGVYGQPLQQAHTWSFGTADGQPQLDEGMYFFFGDLHSHSSYSDGQGMPSEAFATARANGLDFFALTDHAFQLDLSEWHDMGVQAQVATVSDSFVGLRGFEYTSNDFGHLNVFETFDYVHAQDPDYDTLEEFYTWLAAQPRAIGQFNHPYPGMNFEEFAYHAEAAEHIALIEHLGEQSYPDALAAGWRVAPVSNSDTHSADWGARQGVGIVASELTPDAILEGLRARRVFEISTQAAPVGLAMRVNGHWMGEVISTTDYLDVEVTLYNPNRSLDVLSLILYDNGSPVVGTVPLPWQPVYTWHTRIGGAPDHFYYVQATVSSEATGYDYTAHTAPVWTDNSTSGVYLYLPLVIR
jgi:sugar lactone lactonase YvrE/predicted metal-dependent phosphoesterase TrpH